jgi:phosphoserine phosphatase
MIFASDLEGTLSTGSTWKAVARYLNEHGFKSQYRVFLALHLPPYPLAKVGLIDDQAYRNWWMKDLTMFLKGFDTARINDLADYVVAHELWPNRRVNVVAELEQHTRDGHEVILSSGTYQPVLENFARRIGAVALGTPLEMVDGKSTGKLGAPMNTGKVKAATLTRYLNGRTLDGAYGDTHADVPMLELCNTPVAVAPDNRLSRVAALRGWRVVTA